MTKRIRRTHSPAFKAKVALAALKEPVAVSGSKLVPPRHEEVVALRRRA